MPYDLEIIMSQKFLDQCKHNNVIANAIATIENELNEGFVLACDGHFSGPFGKDAKPEDYTQTLYYDLTQKKKT